MSEEFLVIYEEEGDEDANDELVLDVRRLRRTLRTHLDIETGVSLAVDNTSSGLGLIGVIVSALGALGGLAAVIVFASSYPQEWFANGFVAGESVRRLTAALAMAGGLLLVVGTVLTAYGRRVSATGTLDNLQLVRKSPHAKTDLR